MAYKLIPGTDLASRFPDVAKEWDYEKNYPLTPEQVTAHSDKKVGWICNRGHRWEATVASRSQGRGCPYCAGKLPIVGETDLKAVNPILAGEWDCEANGLLTPEQVTAHSERKAGWICNRGHRWEARVKERSRGRGCPYCAGKLPIVGETDLKTVNSILAEEWDYKVNGSLTPEQVTAQSNKIVGWICNRGHRWEATVASRTRGRGCPYCARKLPIVGETDLKTVNPILAGEWDYEANGSLTPEQVTANSNKKVGWKCKKGHRWKARVAGRSRGSGCLYCAGKIPIIGETDLKTVNPTLAGEWDNEANGSLTPEQVTANSEKKVGWVCDRGHRWRAIIKNRSEGAGCPYCAGKLPIVGETDLKTVAPMLAGEWDDEANGWLTPEQVTAHSNKKVGWKCEKGHRWDARVYNRFNGSGCPYCANRLPTDVRNAAKQKDRWVL